MVTLTPEADERGNDARWSCIAVTLVLAIIGVCIGGRSAAALEVALTSARSHATLLHRTVPDQSRALVEWADDPALANPVAPPVCPSTVSVEIATDVGSTGPLLLPCGNWHAAGGGYIYEDGAALVGGVRDVQLGRRGLKLHLQGPHYAPSTGPVAFIEARVAVGGTRYCGRFVAPPSRFVANGPGTILIRGPSTACAPAPPRPNFLVIDLDDTRPDGMDRMATVQSRLMAESVVFDNSFVPMSSCCPSRASFLSGLYAVHHGTRQVGGTIGGADTFRTSMADHQTIAVWLQNAGYTTGLFGKYLNANNLEIDKGPGGGYYVPPGWSRWLAFEVEHYGGVNGPSYNLVNEQGGITSYDDHTTDAQYSTDVTADALRQFVQDSAASGKPFFAVWFPFASHGDSPHLEPIPALRDLNTLTNLGLFRPPNYAEADRSDKPLWDQTFQVTVILEAVTDQIRERAYETLLDADRQLAVMLDQLDALGIADHTVVLLTSDNGVAWGEHAEFAQGKDCPYEDCLRVPFMIHVPGAAAPAVSASPVLNIDIPATIADLAGVSVPVPIDGHSVRPIIEGASGWVRDDFLLETWQLDRNAKLTYAGQPADGDRLRLYYGTGIPKSVKTFEFDSGDGVAPSNIAVAIQGTADATFAALGTAVTSAIPKTTITQDTSKKVFSIVDTSPAQTGLYLVGEVNQSGALTLDYLEPDGFGVRDVRQGFTLMEYADGEAELYDLNVDPWQLNNSINDPAYGGVRATLDQRMRTLAGIP
jgi:arylsulfatase A-like enzyme